MRRLPIGALYLGLMLSSSAYYAFVCPVALSNVSEAANWRRSIVGFTTRHLPKFFGVQQGVVLRSQVLLPDFM